MQHGAILRGHQVNASANRERKRQQRLTAPRGRAGRAADVVLVPAVHRQSDAAPGCRRSSATAPSWRILGLMLVMITGMMMIPLLSSGKSPHTMLRPSDSTIRLADVVGADATRREAIDTLNLFLNHETFAEEMGGSPRRGVLFEGAPGTGKTYLAKAIAAEAEVPFLFVSASEFQSPLLRNDQPQDPPVLQGAPQGGSRRGWRHRVHRGVRRDRHGSLRHGLVAACAKAQPASSTSCSCRCRASICPTGWDKFKSKMIDRVNLLLPPSRALPRPKLKTCQRACCSPPPTAPTASIRR